MKKYSPIEKIAKKILDNIKSPSKDHGFVDPLTLILIISVILTLIRVIQECRSKRNLLKNKKDQIGLMKRDIQELVLKNSWLNNLRLKKIIKQHLNKDQYIVYGKDLQNSIMEVGINLTDSELFTLMEASND